MICHRCPDIEMEDDGEWFVCPCCRCRTRGLERQQARHQARMDELGMTEDEYHEYCTSFINTEPLSERELTRIAAFVRERAAEWQPACVHDTNNPWEAKE